MWAKAIEIFAQFSFQNLIFGGIACALASYLYLFRGAHHDGHVPGLPLLGNAVALGRHGVAFLHSCRRQFGPDHFTLDLAGQRMTFVFNARLIDRFFRAPDEEITFRPAVEQFTQRVFGLPSHEFFPLHLSILTHLRHQLVPAELPGLAAELAERLKRHMPGFLPPGQTVDLYNVTKQLIFRSAVELLFGEQFYACASSFPGKSLEMCFFEFEEGFEMAASPIPHRFQPKFMAVRAALVERLEYSLAAGHMEGTIAGELLARSGLRKELAPKMLLAILWASQANTVPAVFWTLAFLLLPENAQHRQDVLSELQLEEQVAQGQAAAAMAAAAGVPGGAGASKLPTRCGTPLATALHRLASRRQSTVSRCVAEATRLRVQSIDVRIAAKDLLLQGRDGAPPVRLPRGRIIAICPFESHHDPELYGPNAWVFDPARKGLQLDDGTAVVHSVAGLAFGGGIYRCPGRFFAEMEVALAVQLILRQYDIQLVNSPAIDSKGAASGSSNTTASELMPNSELGVCGCSGLLSWLAWAATAIGGAHAQFGLGLLPRAGQSETVTVTQGAATKQARTNGGGEAGGDVARRLGGSAVLLDWRSSGDPGLLLPSCNLVKLVGVKVPVSPCIVTAQPR